MKEKRDWPSIFNAFERSGLTQRGFCLEHDIVLATFKHQRYLQRKSPGASGFSQLAVSPPVALPPPVELHFPDGLFLRFAGGVAPGYLREVIAGLRP
jgi:hypothetical protein